MKLSKLFLVLLMAVSLGTLSACGGGGGGSGGGSSTDPGGGGATGSADFTNVTSNLPDITCIKNGAFRSTVPSTSAECAAHSGTWGVASSGMTGDRCVINGLTYAYAPGGTAGSQDRDACAAHGGVYQVSENVDVYSCTGYSGNTCASVGGTEVTIYSVSGSIEQSTMALVNGNNTITGETGISGLSCAIQDGAGKSCVGTGATETPKFFQTTSKIKNGANYVRWIASILRVTGSSFSGYTGSPGDATSFTVNMPISTGVKEVNGTNEYLIIEGSNLYYIP